MRKQSFKSLLKKFPISKTNQNCLYDIACPSCGQRSSFDIEITKIIRQFDDGIYDFNDTEYDDSAYCRCILCKHAGVLGSFRFTGLDKSLNCKN